MDFDESEVARTHVKNILDAGDMLVAELDRTPRWRCIRRAKAAESFGQRVRASWRIYEMLTVTGETAE